MRLWFDTEFIEAGHQFPLELISIGVVRDDGEEYYAEVRDFDLAMALANPWLVENVIPHLGLEKRYEDLPLSPDNALQSGEQWKTRKEIANDIIGFAGPKPEWWGYYADYDWVLLCQLFGRMIDLPPDWPMYCLDAKQWCVQLGNPKLPRQETGAHNAMADARWHKVMWDFLNEFSHTLY